MREDSGRSGGRQWHDSAHASLCLLGWYLRHVGFLAGLAEGITIGQKTLKSTAAQKVVMLFASLLAGAKAVALAKSTQQHAVRTPSTEQASGYSSAVSVSTRSNPTMPSTVDHYDRRAGIEAEIKADKHGLALATIRKHKLAAQTIVVPLMEPAHNVLIWSRRWLGPHAPRRTGCGIVGLIHEVWAIHGRIKLVEDAPLHVRLHREHPSARDLLAGSRPLLLPSQSLAFLG